ncbi:MAG: hypothetical protein IPQ07_22410 [Myxococcales bacterium]|nr:hypothetical protein [Myxococcales bacterium]
MHDELRVDLPLLGVRDQLLSEQRAPTLDREGEVCQELEKAWGGGPMT